MNIVLKRNKGARKSRKWLIAFQDYVNRMLTGNINHLTTQRVHTQLQGNTDHSCSEIEHQDMCRLTNKVWFDVALVFGVFGKTGSVCS